MNKIFGIICVITLSASCFSCKENENTQKNQDIPVEKPIAKIQSLKYKSGIRAIFQDSKGNYWFGSHNEGVSIYDGNKFEYFTTYDGLADNQVRSIKEGQDGIIWFGTANGVSSYDGSKIINHGQTTNYNFQSENKETDNVLWFNAGNNPGVNIIDDQDLKYLNFPIPKNNNQNDSYGVTGISKGKDARVWIATYSALFYADGKALNIFENSKLALKPDEHLHIRSVFEDSKGRVWVGNNGIGVLLIEDGNTINFSDSKGLIHKNSTKNGHRSPTGTLEHVFVINEDSEGNIWFGDRDTGAWKYDGKNIMNYGVDAKLSTPMIWSIYNDKNNNLLFGMADGGVYKFNGKTFDKMF